VLADDPTKPTKGEMAKGIRLLIANARDDEELFNDLGRHWYASTFSAEVKHLCCQVYACTDSMFCMQQKL